MRHTRHLWVLGIVKTDENGLVRVPTVEELAARGLARQQGGDTRWTIVKAGYVEMRAAMAHNAEVLKADPALSRRLSLAGYTS